MAKSAFPVGARLLQPRNVLREELVLPRMTTSGGLTPDGGADTRHDDRGGTPKAGKTYVGGWA
jgi:hypothetical protein